MKCFKIWMIIPLNWILIFGYYMLAHSRLDIILPSDFRLHMRGYTFGRCSAALLVTLILYLICVLFERRIMKRNKDNTYVRRLCIAAITLLSISFAIQILGFLDWYGWINITKMFQQFKREWDAIKLPDLHFIKEAFSNKRPKE